MKIKLFILLVLILLCCCFFSGCKSVEYVPVEKVTTKTEYRDRVSRDTICVRDSVFIRGINDTIYIYKWRTEYHEKLRIDTAYINHTDTIRETITMQRPRSRYDIVTARGFWVLLVLLIAFVAYKIYKFFKL